MVGLAHELGDSSRAFGTEEKTALLQVIRDHSEEASAIVEDLLMAARSDIKGVSIQPEPLDLGEVAGSVLATTQLPAIKITGHPGTAFADSSRVRQIMRNLLTNASRYGGPNVEVRFSESASAVSFVVADNGAAIPKRISAGSSTPIYLLMMAELTWARSVSGRMFPRIWRSSWEAISPIAMMANAAWSS